MNDLVQLLFLTKIDDNQPIKSISQVCERSGNFFLSPMHYFLKGRTYRLIGSVGSDYSCYSKQFSYSDEEKNLLKTIGMVVAFIPGLYLGSFFKACSFMSQDILDKYQKIGKPKLLEFAMDIFGNEKDGNKIDKKTEIDQLCETSLYLNGETLDCTPIGEISEENLLILNNYAYDLSGNIDSKVLAKIFSNKEMCCPYTRNKFDESHKQQYLNALKARKQKIVSETEFKLSQELIENGLALAKVLYSDEGTDNFLKSINALIDFQEKNREQKFILSIKISGGIFEDNGYKLTTLADLMEAVSTGFNCNLAGILIWKTFTELMSKKPKPDRALLEMARRCSISLK